MAPAGGGGPGGDMRATWFHTGAPIVTPGGTWADPSGRAEGPPASGLGHDVPGIATPGGAPQAFWDAVTQTSMPHSSTSSSVAPAPDTLSTMKSLPESRMTAAISFSGLRTPVEVSLCVMSTALAPSLPFSLASSSRTRSGSTARP